ncbi:MAG: hypothetical protein PVG50_07075, partial [Thiohalophilus sp.]
MDVVIKQREIVFSPLHPEPNQARAASLLLVGVDGVEHVDALETTRLLIRYDIRRITLAII